MTSALTPQQQSKLVALNFEMEKLRNRNPVDPRKRIRMSLNIERSARETAIFEAEVANEKMKVSFHHLINQHQLIISALEGLHVYVEINQDIVTQLSPQNQPINFYENFDVIKRNGIFKANSNKPSLGTYLFLIKMEHLTLVDQNVDSSD